MKPALLIRVSTKEQEDGHSLEAQKMRLTDYAKTKGLNDVKLFKIVESSTIGSRKKFNEMIEWAKSQKEKVAIIADAVDRIQRSFKESILLDDLRKKGKVEIHFLRENIIISENSQYHEIAMWDFATMGAKMYIGSLSQNVKRSIEKKLRCGEWIRKAPIGYCNTYDPITNQKTVIQDPVKAPLIKKAFEMYATGLYSLQKITNYLKEEGVMNNSKTNKPLSKSQVHKLLQQPFYYGIMRVKEKFYPHNYKPIIDEFLFNQCQKVREGWHKQPFKYNSKSFIFKGLIKCSHCGCTISTDRKKNKYNYLSCSKYKGNCENKRVNEEKILAQVQDVFDKLKIPEHILKNLVEKLKTSQEAKKEYQNEKLNALQKEYKQIQQKLDFILDKYIDQIINQEEYQRKSKELNEQKTEIGILIEDMHQADKKFAITVEYLLSLTSKASDLFQGSKVEEKRALISFALSNLNLKHGKLVYNLKKPFDIIVKANECSNWLPR